MRSVIAVVISSSFFFARQAFAAANLNYTLDGVHAFDFAQVVNLPTDAPAVQLCAQNCSVPFQSITSCASGANSPTCFCTPDLLSQLKDCEQCMFDDLVLKNVKQPSPLVGSNPVVTGLVNACKNATMPFNDILSKTALSLGPNWDGPFGQHLDTGSTVVVVAVTAILGSSALYIFSTLE